MSAPDVHEIAQKQALLEQRFDDNFRSFWKRYDDLGAQVKEHHHEDDMRFAEVRKLIEDKHAEAMVAIGDLRDQYTKILAGIVVACIVMMVNAAALWVRGSH